MAISSPRPTGRDRSGYLLETTLFAEQLCRVVGTVLGRRAVKLIKSGNHRALLELGVNPSSYTNPVIFHRDWLVVNLMSKFPKLNLGIDTAEVALTAFQEGEALCSATNRRLSSRYDTPTTGVSGDSLIETARRKIALLLGDFSWDRAEPFMSFTSGASTSRKRTMGHPYFKYQGKLDVTHQAALLACCAISRVPAWDTHVRDMFGLDPVNWVNVVKGNRLAVVPKNAKTDRMIAIEPDLNMFLQKGIGGVIRQSLKTVGIDLDDQTRNQRLAREGSLNDSLATLDLKAASDCVSVELVRRLMPPDWFSAMDTVRSHIGTLPSGEIIRFQKFSSMGNGFTFELESLIFWALCSSVTDLLDGSDRRVAVFGDDLIVPKAASGWVVELLEYVGFKTNVQKSFETGPFRESCGKHYFRGMDVTPFQIKKVLDNAHSRYWVLNSLRKWAARLTDGQLADYRYRTLYETWTHRFFPSGPAKVPDGIGDGGLISTFIEARPRKCRKTHGWRVKLTITGVGKIKHVDGVSMYLASIQGQRVSQPYDVLFDDYRSEITAIDYRTQRALLSGGKRLPPSVVVERERKWTKTLLTSISQWLDAPLWWRL